MHSFIPTLLLAALASTVAGLPNFHGPVNFKHDSPTSVPFPTGTGIPAFSDNDFKPSSTGHRGAFGTGTAHGTGAHGRPHHHHTGTGGHHTASATLAVRQFSESDASFTGSFPTSFPIPTGTGGRGGFPHGTGFGGARPTGCEGPGHHPHVSHSKGSLSPTGNARNFPRQFPSGSTGPSGGFPSMSIPTATGFGCGAPTGGFGHGFPHGTGHRSGPNGGFPTAGFPMPTGGRRPHKSFSFPTTFQTSVAAPSSAAP